MSTPTKPQKTARLRLAYVLKPAGPTLFSGGYLDASDKPPHAMGQDVYTQCTGGEDCTVDVMQVISGGGFSVSFRMTPAEALALARQLQVAACHAAELVRLTERGDA